MFVSCVSHTQTEVQVLNRLLESNILDSLSLDSAQLFYFAYGRSETQSVIVVVSLAIENDSMNGFITRMKIFLSDL